MLATDYGKSACSGRGNQCNFYAATLHLQEVVILSGMHRNSTLNSSVWRSSESGQLPNLQLELNPVITGLLMIQAGTGQKLLTTLWKKSF